MHGQGLDTQLLHKIYCKLQVSKKIANFTWTSKIQTPDMAFKAGYFFMTNFTFHCLKTKRSLNYINVFFKVI